MARRGPWRARMLPVAGLATFLAAWWLVVEVFAVPPYIAPSPVLVLETLVDRRGVLLANLLPTALEAAGGFVLGNLAAALLAAVFVHSAVLRAMLLPVFLLLNAIPVVAKAPILVLLLGSGFAPKATIAAMVCFFPTLVNTVRGLDALNPQAMDLMRVLSASPREIFFRLRVFSAVPYLFSALRISASLCVIGAIVGEWIGTDVGIGALILQATYNFDSALLYAAIVVGSCLSGAFYLVVVAVERLVVRWPAGTAP